MKLSAILEPLIAAGVPGHVILETVKAFEAQEEGGLEKRREADRKRQAEKRSRDRMSRDSRDVTVTVVTPKPRARVEDITSNIEATGEGKKEDRSPPAPTPRQALEAVLDSEHAAAVVDHRKRLKKPLTPQGAKVLAGKFAKCSDPNAAADEMLANGWLRVEAEWFDRPRSQPHAINGNRPPPPDRQNGRIQRKLLEDDADGRFEDYPALDLPAYRSH